MLIRDLVSSSFDQSTNMASTLKSIVGLYEKPIILCSIEAEFETPKYFSTKEFHAGITLRGFL